MRAQTTAEGKLIALRYLERRHGDPRRAQRRVVHRERAAGRARAPRPDEIGRDQKLALRRHRRRQPPRRGRHPDRRHLLHRHRFSPGSAPRRPVHRGLRDVLRPGRVAAHRPRARRRVHQQRQGLPGGLVPARARTRAATTRSRARTSARRSCALRSSSRASPPASPTPASIRCCRSGARTAA